MTQYESRIDTTPTLRVSDADRGGTLRRLHNAVALGLIDIGEFEERSAQVSTARQPAELEALVEDLQVRGRSPRRPRTDWNCGAGWDRCDGRASGPCRPASPWCAGSDRSILI